MRHNFRQMQSQLTEFIRHKNAPNYATADDEKRLLLYRHLARKNIENIIKNALPHFFENVSKTQWQVLIDDYIENGAADSPLFYRIPENFLSYLLKQSTINFHPCLLELAHYENLKLALDIAEPEVNAFKIDKDLLKQYLTISAASCLVKYQYPVHEIKNAEHYQQACERTVKPHYLIGYRKVDDRVEFLLVNDFAAKLYELLLTKPHLSAWDVLTEIAQATNYHNQSSFYAGGEQLIRLFIEKNIIVA